MYDENSDEVLTYTAGVGWHEKESKAETEVHGALKAAYYSKIQTEERNGRASDAEMCPVFFCGKTRHAGIVPARMPI